MVVKNLNDTLKGNEAIGNFNRNEAKISTICKNFARKIKIISTTTNPKRINYHSLLRNLWLDPGNRINIYTVNLATDNCSFEFGVLKEFQNPEGIFILIEAHFEPPYRSNLNKTE